MVSISTLSRKFVSTRRNEAFHKRFVSASRKNCFCCQVKNKRKSKKIGLHLISSVHQKRKAPNKSIKFAINQKSVSTCQNERFPEKCDFTGPKSYFHSDQCLKKKRTRFLLAETRCFKNFGLPLIAIMVSKKNVNERISSPPKRKSVATDCNEGFV